MIALILSASLLLAASEKIETAPMPKRAIDLTGYHTTKTANKADPKSFPEEGARAALLGYLGVAFAERSGKVILEDVEAESPADAAGLKAGDIVVKINGAPVTSVSSAKDKLHGLFAGALLPLSIERADQKITLTATLKPLSKPFPSSEAQRVILGIQLKPATSGIEITSVTNNGPADKAGLKVGDVILKVNDIRVSSDSVLRDVLLDKAPGDTVRIIASRGKEELKLTATVAVASTRGGLSGWDDRLPKTFRKPSYKLAVIGVEYPDTKHSEKITDKDWEAQLFSKGTYTGKNATGNSVHGSVADYYRELSYGKLKLEGKFFGWVEVGKKKMDYNLGSSTKSTDKSKFFNEVMDKGLARWGKDAFKDYDGIFVMFAGDPCEYQPRRALLAAPRQLYPRSQTLELFHHPRAEPRQDDRHQRAVP